MGSAKSTLSSAEAVASQLECSACVGQLCEPKILNCGHTFCRGCLEELVKTEYGSKKTAGLVVTCPLCPQLGDVEDGELNICEVHKEKMKFYCITCDLLICRDCTIVDHPRADHKCTNLDEAYTWRQQISQKEIQQAKALIKLTKKARGILLATGEDLNQRCDKVINEIETCREEGKNMLNSKDALMKEYQNTLEARMQHLCDLTQHAKGTTTKIDVLGKSKGLVEKLSSCRDKQHEVLSNPSKVQYPMFAGAAEEILGWPKPNTK